MSQRLKRWESPRREGRNDKGRGGSARQRQKQKQLKALRQKLKQTGQQADDHGGKDSNGLFPLRFFTSSVVQLHQQTECGLPTTNPATDEQWLA
ncbi:hypothetical protein [Leptolyngbya sp. 7M]|uniref:hypothetical protein n=1 Tax=Leptolyngbya sp. 7M TaxID=2812896 RepID=UPI001B8D2267|nr:hypothetical protein [Leptolyngbya sp. 7M]QYO68897.1 hypothetical protein JVX88_24365 [Leptolyngbya sp. 7M]